jgi:hypothetical protein
MIISLFMRITPLGRIAHLPRGLHPEFDEARAHQGAEHGEQPE